jgi:hypothetical protein
MFTLVMLKPSENNILPHGAEGQMQNLCSYNISLDT